VHDGELLTVTVRACTASQKKRYFIKAPFLQVGDAILEFSVKLDFPGQDIFFRTDHLGNKIVGTLENSVAYWKSFLSIDLDVTIQSYLCALTIAYQGAVRPTGNVWIQDGSQYRTDRYHWSIIHEAVEFLREKNAFPEINVEVDRIVFWTFSQNGLFDGYSDTPASRALNYFTRLFVKNLRNDELSDLVWALAGVEALLVDAGRSSVGQLKEKLGTLFGDSIDRPWLSRMIADAYNFRSRMVHGDRQIRSFFRDDEDGSKKRFDEEYNSCMFAVGILVLLLRFVISKNMTEIPFKTVLND